MKRVVETIVSHGKRNLSPNPANFRFSNRANKNKSRWTSFCFGEPEAKLLEHPDVVAKTLYDNTNVIHYPLPEIKKSEIAAIMADVDYIL